MKQQSWVPILLTAAAMAAPQAVAQTRADFGKHLYDANCAVCHGVTGQGDGPYRDWLKREAPGLTAMARRNGGVFPVAWAYQVIDGSAGSGHGTRDMPLWGQEFAVQAESAADTHQAAAFVRGRILALIEYLERLQVR